MTQNWYLPHNSHPTTLLYNARIIDPATRADIMGGILIKNGLIIDFGKHLFTKESIEAEIKHDIQQKLIVPGLLDIQVHFRDPGQTHKEDIISGSKSAASGGITRVVCQPNTKPVIDSPATLDYINYKAKAESYIHIHSYASISKNMEGKELSEFALLKEHGAVGFTDDGLPVMNALMMRRALEYSKILNVPIAQHAEDLNLTNGGAINEGVVSFELGVPGIPNASESVIVARDIDLTRLTGGYYHVLHVSTKEAIKHIQLAKAEGLNVTCEVAPHHFLLTDQTVLEKGTLAKMNPPLRSEEDRLNLIDAIKQGVVDAIATDHAPHDAASKDQPLTRATFGIVGLETMLPLSLELHFNYGVDLIDLISLMTNKPAEIIRVKAGQIAKNYPADLTVIDLDLEWTIEAKKFASRSNNTPFDGRKVRGRAIKTFVNGHLVYEFN
ncbi:dihydroorotase [Rickettsiales endosymbiont of Stachyamoeba lipophora]|uniref:dihydroorotase n=1 Tax=Rickettsiales endosymbiont of Stachyamoeba lipophora TaxID=2486578 RepID=UPI000F64F523|nr:dihydroorotase [Rickettsiales endosymbiont of Stachyamoeba lipophora]AZL15141.1 dihydroorotase [Rickettsiales endosymbiont of Stachyamoeba lipophora]